MINMVFLTAIESSRMFNDDDDDDDDVCPSSVSSRIVDFTRFFAYFVQLRVIKDPSEHRLDLDSENSKITVFIFRPYCIVGAK
jgi:hypothetical protein